MNEKDFAETAARYRRFAEREARDRSLLYEKFARCIARDRELLRLLLELPSERRQPNVLLAAVRHLFGVQSRAKGFRCSRLTRGGELHRETQAVGRAGHR
jgi:hypothetical protein